MVTTERKVGESRHANRGNAGKGRRKGVPNKISGQLREMILGALDAAGGQDYLLRQANQHPGAFLTLIGRVLPTTLSNDPESPFGRMSEAELDAEIARLQAKQLAQS